MTNSYHNTSLSSSQIQKGLAHRIAALLAIQAESILTTRLIQMEEGQMQLNSREVNKKSIVESLRPKWNRMRIKSARLKKTKPDMRWKMTKIWLNIWVLMHQAAINSSHLPPSSLPCCQQDNLVLLIQTFLRHMEGVSWCLKWITILLLRAHFSSKLRVALTTGSPLAYDWAVTLQRDKKRRTRPNCQPSCNTSWRSNSRWRSRKLAKKLKNRNWRERTRSMRGEFRANKRN